VVVVALFFVANLFVQVWALSFGFSSLCVFVE